MSQLDPDTIARLKADVVRRGYAAVAREIGLSSGALARALSGGSVHRGTVAAIMMGIARPLVTQDGLSGLEVR